MDVGRKFFSAGAILHWQRLPREVVRSPSLEVVQNCGGVALRDVISGDGLRNHRGLSQL